MAIVDGRTLLDNANAITSWAAFGTVTLNSDGDTVKFGSASVATTSDNTSGGEGIAYDDGGDSDWTDRIVYLWVNIANPGLMEVKASGGIRVRCANNAGITNFVERNFEGSDTYSGGWKMFVIDVNDVFANADNTGGTPPVITAMRYIGVVCDLITGAMPKMQDNLFLDAIWYLDKGTPGIRVEGTNGGNPWNWADIVDAGDEFDTTKAWGHVQINQKNIILFSSIQFGDDGNSESPSLASTFEDATGAIVTFGQGANDLPDDIYEITVVGNSDNGSTITFGAVVGSGDDRQGIGGTIWQTAGPQYTFDGETDISEVTGLNFYSGIMSECEEAQFSSFSKTSIIGFTFTGCAKVQINDAEFLNSAIVAPKARDINPDDYGLELLTTHNAKNISFIAGEVTGESPTAQEVHILLPETASPDFEIDFDNFQFFGFDTAASPDLPGYDGKWMGEISGGTSVIINALNTSNPQAALFKVTAAGGDVSVVNAVTLSVTCVDALGNAIEGMRVRIENDPAGTLIAQGETNASGIFSSSFNFEAVTAVLVKARLKGFIPNRTLDSIDGDGLGITFVMQNDTIVNLP